MWYDPSKPRDLPQWAHLHLVTVLKIDPDTLAGLKCAERPDYEDDIPVMRVRLYEPDTAPAGSRITSYESLDQHPHLILYEGYRTLAGEQVFLESTYRSPSQDASHRKPPNRAAG
jgi:hypothetical protein